MEVMFGVAWFLIGNGQTLKFGFDSKHTKE